jgi:hypothetical protein
MISKVKTLNPKTKGQTIKEKATRMPEMETRSVGHNIQQYQHHPSIST